MKNKTLALLVIFSLLTCSANLYAKERRGAELVITQTDGQQIKGELIAVKGSSLLLLDSQSATELAVGVSDIRAIRIVRKAKFWMAGISIAIAAGLGSMSQTEGGWFAGALYLGIPLAIPVILLSGKDQTIQIAKKSKAEIKTILEELREQARIKDAQ